jgi:hypothetical protein
VELCCLKMNSLCAILSPAPLPAHCGCTLQAASKGQVSGIHFCSEVCVQGENGAVVDDVEADSPHSLAWRIAAFTRHPSNASSEDVEHLMTDYEREEQNDSESEQHTPPQIEAENVCCSAVQESVPASPAVPARAADSEQQSLKISELDWENELDGVNLEKWMKLLKSLKQLLKRGEAAARAERETECCSPPVRRRSLPTVASQLQVSGTPAENAQVDEAEYIPLKLPQAVAKPSNGQSPLWQRRRKLRTNPLNHSF